MIATKLQIWCHYKHVVHFKHSNLNVFLSISKVFRNNPSLQASYENIAAATKKPVEKVQGQSQGQTVGQGQGLTENFVITHAANHRAGEEMSTDNQTGQTQAKEVVRIELVT